MNYLNCNWKAPWPKGSLSNDDGDVNENGKKAIGFHWQNSSSARLSRFFCTFLCRHFMTTTWKCLISRFMKGREHKTTTFFFFSWTSIQSFRIQLQRKLPTFDELNEMEKCDKVWNSAASLFKPPITISQYAKTLCTSSTSHETQMHKPQGKKTAKLSARLREIVLFPQI